MTHPRVACWLMVPVKPFFESKSRLAGVLDSQARAALSRQLLEDVLTRSRESGLFAEILVISRDEAARAIAQAHGVRSLHESPRRESTLPATTRQQSTGAHPITARAQTTAGGSQQIAHVPEATLNQALHAGRDHALAGGAQAILVLPADLPLLTTQDLAALVAPLQKRPPPQVIIAPSHDEGTNALLLHPPTIIDFAYGPQSFARHCALAQAANSTVEIVRSSSLTYDLDLPEDLWGEELGI
ncbi:MAG: 2-phospho-L-lactate guanylyltransferase [Litorilinea sp.]